MKEEWKAIKGYDGMYSVSNLGNVIAHARVVPFGNRYRKTKEHLLSQTNNGTGYLKVYISFQGKTKSYFVHRLVADAFLGSQPSELHEVNHIDYNKTNNAASNLEWVTRKENIEHSRCNFAKRHNERTTTGERYIGMRGNRFRVCLGCDKQFKTLNEAIAYRNGKCREMGISI